MTVLMSVLAACGRPDSNASRTPFEPPTADQVEIVCDEKGQIHLARDVVRTSADGVHIRVDNRSGEPVSINKVLPTIPQGSERPNGSLADWRRALVTSDRGYKPSR